MSTADPEPESEGIDGRDAVERLKSVKKSASLSKQVEL
jgi:hypothetical protein